MTDAQTIQRFAQPLIVETIPGSGSPPGFGGDWLPVWNCAVHRVTQNAGARPSEAVIRLVGRRWNDAGGFRAGDRVRIRSAHATPTLLFSGFVVRRMPEFQGGNQHGGASESSGLGLLDHRWLMSIGRPVVGQWGRGPDDFYDWGLGTETAKADGATFFSGRRAIFNRDGEPDMDPVWYNESSKFPLAVTMPLFAARRRGQSWTARAMIQYLLAAPVNAAAEYLSTVHQGLDADGFDAVLHNVVVDGLPIPEAMEAICGQIGFSFREDYDAAGRAYLQFYRIGSPSGYVRSSSAPVIFQQLYAPAVGEEISTAVANGERLVHAMQLSEDITPVINAPLGLGAPDRFEFTVELVPGWLDADLSPDSTDSYANVFKTEAELQDETSPNSYTYYKYYHARGSEFRRAVGRKWVLNETGDYSGGSYDRGLPLDWSTLAGQLLDAEGYVIEAITDAEGKRVFGPFGRQLLPCLTLDSDSLNSLGILVEFSFDGGSTWQTIPCAINGLEAECGIWIADANLAELVDQANGSIGGGALAGKQKNYWVSLCDDKVNSRSFKLGAWHTRVRVTASVQLDQRLRRGLVPTDGSGSPFWHVRVYDLSERYGLSRRLSASQFYNSSLPAEQFDDADIFGPHLRAIQEANQDESISGMFEMERMWLGEGSGVPQFLLGDAIEGLRGREYWLGAAIAGRLVYPEIVQIEYLPDRQLQRLITRDLRFATASLL